MLGRVFLHVKSRPIVVGDHNENLKSDLSCMCVLNVSIDIENFLCYKKLENPYVTERSGNLYVL